MNASTARILCKITHNFYQEYSSSFSATRAHPWSGWRKCFEGDAIERDVFKKYGQNVSVFDLACGNLRFETFIGDFFPDTTFSYYAVDNCKDLLPAEPLVNYQNLDVVAAVQKGLPLKDCYTAPLCDVAVSFGFMHHVPSQAYRRKILESLVEQTRVGGYVVVSFWQFLTNDHLKRKALSTHKQALQELNLPELDANDYVLGWKNIPGAYRYCHSFSQEEIDQLVELLAGKATLVARFVADGRTDNLNTYLIFKVQ